MRAQRYHPNRSLLQTHLRRHLHRRVFWPPKSREVDPPSFQYRGSVAFWHLYWACCQSHHRSSWSRLRCRSRHRRYLAEDAVIGQRVCHSLPQRSGLIEDRWIAAIPAPPRRGGGWPQSRRRPQWMQVRHHSCCRKGRRQGIVLLVGRSQ